MEKTYELLPVIAENGIKYDHFPTRMQAFLFKNWGMVPKERLATCLECSVSEVEAEALKMGLPPQGDVSTWLKRGYVSIIKQNWSLIPYEQLLKLLDWNEKKLAMVLKDEDFLQFKLGAKKPSCEKIVYKKLTADEEAETLKIKKLISETFPVNPSAKESFNFFENINSYLPSTSRKKADGVCIDSSWGIIDNTKCHISSKIISRYKKQFENRWNISLSGTEKYIIFELFADKNEEEYHEISISDNAINVTASDSAGILRALVYLEDLSNVNGGLIFDKCNIKRKARFKTRIIYPFTGLYNDALDVDSNIWCPDSLLDSYSKSGVNAIWIQGILYRLADFPFEPSLSIGKEDRIKRLNELINRGAEYGIKVFLYLNEPRAMNLPFFDNHKDILGSKRNGVGTMCTSSPKVQKYLTEAVEFVCQNAEGLGGIFIISASENMNNCHAWVMDEPCQICSSKPIPEIVAKVNNLICEAAHKVNPDIKVIVWDWGWRRKELMSASDVENCIKSLSDGAILMSGRERGIPINKGGIKGEIEDYTFCVTGVGEMAKDAFRWAAKSGHETAAKLAINNTWECSTIPYIPLFRTVETIISDVEKEGVKHIMLSWTLGGAPSPNIKVVSQHFFETYGENASAPDIYNVMYGNDAEAVKKATNLFCDAFFEFPFEHSGIYLGPANNGASNLLYDYKTGMRASMTCYSYDNLENWRTIYPTEIYLGQFEKMCKLWENGLKILENVQDEELKSMAKATYIQLLSSVNQIKFICARDAGKSDEMVQLAKAEKELAINLYNIMEEYPQVGFEATNHYYYTKGSLMEKVINCQHIIDKYC